MTMYVDETLGLTPSQVEQVVKMMDIFNIYCEESNIDGDKTHYTVNFKPITYKNITYYITLESIKSLITFLEFKHLEINQNGFCKFVFIPYNQRIWEDIQELSFRDR